MNGRFGDSCCECVGPHSGECCPTWDIWLDRTRGQSSKFEGRGDSPADQRWRPRCDVTTYTRGVRMVRDYPCPGTSCRVVRGLASATLDSSRTAICRMALGSCVSGVIRAPWEADPHDLARVANVRKRAHGLRSNHGTPRDPWHRDLDGLWSKCRGENVYIGMQLASWPERSRWIKSVAEIGVFENRRPNQLGQFSAPRSFIRMHYASSRGDVLADRTWRHPNSVNNCLEMLRLYESIEGRAHWRCPRYQGQPSPCVVTQDDWYCQPMRCDLRTAIYGLPVQRGSIWHDDRGFRVTYD